MPKKRTSGTWRYVPPAKPGRCGEIVARRAEPMPDGTPVDVLIAAVLPQGDEADGNAELLFNGAERHDELLDIVKRLAALPPMTDPTKPAATAALATLKTRAEKYQSAT